MTDVPTLVFLLIVALCSLRALWRRRRRAELVVSLRAGVKLAAEAEQHEWRVERRYTDDLERLVRLRPGLRPYLEARDAEWDLSAFDGGSGFELAVMTGRVTQRSWLPWRAKLIGWRHLLSAHGDQGQVSFESF